MKRSIILLAFALSACAHHDWVKDGVNEQDSAKVRLACLREASIPDSQQAINVNVGTSGGVASRRGWGKSNSNYDKATFEACMESEGFEWKPVSN